MRPLVIVDFSHTANRMLFTAISKTNPRKIKGKYVSEEWIPYWEFLMFNSLQFIKNKFKGEMLLAMDSKNNWRKQYYNDYKAHRKKGKDDSEIIFDDFYNAIEKTSENIRLYFPFKVLKVPETEADDIAGVISNRYGQEREIILVTSDHDWKQVMAKQHKVKMWDPIKKDWQELSEYEKELIKTPNGEMSRFTLHHTLLGDSGDNVPTITGKTEFSDNFKSYLGENEITNYNVNDFFSMSISDELIENYNVYKITKSGKNKGKETDEKDIFKTVPFGIKKAEKVSVNEDTLLEFLHSHPLYFDAFERNATLVDFNMIPANTKNSIINGYKQAEVSFDPDGILNFFMNEGMGQLVNNVSKFYDSSYKIESNTSLDDFF